ncbi:amino acid adenylation domain-containing protein [Rhodococcus erythropolis]|uniref:AMP-binding protein n=1 Tax=Rhodococcus erythropolis TaxID=1833 RepID=UPI002169799D|nr:AMP-binding protein [Rhodococcus erythropolis]MCS4255800.1 amino acid adenylation domain-containing protein [Rhodococcus erythropolis]MCW2425317.1 amino acid adenylation domain-containing protein [Rhodococcus erythropolis]
MTAPRLADFLSRSARTAPTSAAIVADGHSLNYAELLRRVTDVAGALTAGGVDRGCRVGVYLQRSIDAIVVVHAAVRVEAVVAPLDVRDPAIRTATLVSGAALACIVTDAAHLPSLRDVGVDWPAVKAGSLLLVVDPDASAPDAEDGYLLFTSGSTGVPKGVLLSTAAVANFAAAAVEAFGLTSVDRVAAQSALTFDLSTFDIFSVAAAGAAHVLVPDFLKSFPQDLVEWLGDERITTIYAVPTLLRSITDAIASPSGVQADAGHAALPALRTIAFAGEPYPERALAELLTLFGTARLLNLYGPTETNVCTIELIAANWTPDQRLSIGLPCAGLDVCLVDDDLTPTDGKGELVVAGPSLLRGYLIDGILYDPTTSITFPDRVTRRSYRTGDIASRGADGRFYLHGRRDTQIKRRGYRIDLAGIDTLVGEVNGVRACVTVPTGPDNQVVLFVEPTSDGHVTVLSDVRTALHRSLPVPHLPDRITLMTSIPRNSRGKIDLHQVRSLADDIDTQREDTIA